MAVAKKKSRAGGGAAAGMGRAAGAAARPAPVRRRLRAGERRQEIMRAAMTVFAERGYTGASMASIAAAAGITPAVIYDHFESKAALQITLLERETEALFAFVGAAVLAAPDVPAERMRRGMDAFFEYVEREPFAWRMLFHEAPTPVDVAPAYESNRRRTTQGLMELIRLGAPPELFERADGERDLEIFAELMRAAQVALANWWWDHRDVPRAEVVDRIIEFCWLGLDRFSRGERA